MSVMPKERFDEEWNRVWNKFLILTESPHVDDRFLKLKKVIEKIRQAPGRKKIFSVTKLRLLQKYQPLFRNEYNAVLVQSIELLQKLLLHKKILREE